VHLFALQQSAGIFFSTPTRIDIEAYRHSLIPYMSEVEVRQSQEQGYPPSPGWGTIGKLNDKSNGKLNDKSNGKLKQTRNKLSSMNQISCTRQIKFLHFKKHSWFVLPHPGIEISRFVLKFGEFRYNSVEI
jgi:hypothetical protein